MGKLRSFVAKGLIHRDLSYSVVDMIITAHDQIDPHLGVINDYDEIVGRVAICALNNQIIKLFIFNSDGALDTIDKCGIALVRSFKTNDEGGVRLIDTFAAGAIVAWLAATLHCLFSLGI